MMTEGRDSDLPTWSYIAETPEGRTLKGELRGRSEGDILRLVRQMGAQPVDVRQIEASASLFSGSTARLSPADLELFARGLADLLGAGISLSDSIQSLARTHKRKRLKAFLERISGRLAIGDSLAAALVHDPVAPPRLLVGLIRAGEESGALATVMERYADKVERDNSLRQDLEGQMVYPALLSGLIVLTLAFLAWFVLPNFEGIFDDAAAAPPAATRFVLDAGAFVRNWGVWIPPGVLALAIGLKWLVEINGASIGKWIRATPILGTISRQMLVDKYFGAMGFLMASGAPVVRAEAIARESINSVAVRAELERAAGRVKSGSRLSDALGETGLFDDEVLHMVGLGEKSGELDRMLSRAALMSQKAYSRSCQRLSELVGPAMIAVLGLLVCSVIISVMVGILSLNEAVY